MCAKTYSNRFICIRCEDFETNRSLSFLVIEKGQRHWTVFILPLSSYSLDLQAIFCRRLLTSLERNIYKISRNPNAQFSASIFSGIRSTHIIFSPIASCKWNIRTTVRVYIYIYVCERVRAQSSKRKNVEEGTNERGKIVDSMGSITFARQNANPVSFFTWSILFVNWIIWTDNLICLLRF